MSTAWYDRLGVFDLETTGIDVETARIVTAFIGVMDTATGEMVDRWTWVIDPGIPVPTAASERPVPVLTSPTVK